MPVVAEVEDGGIESFSPGKFTSLGELTDSGGVSSLKGLKVGGAGEGGGSRV